MNGCGTSGVAEKFTDLLRSKNFDVVKVGNYYSFDVDTTFIIDRIGDKKYALAVAESLGVPIQNVIQHFNKNYFLDVTFVIGKDFNNYLKR
ncbi:MAG: LytR C-terminal domain-containing protein [Ignavibacterium sp.]|nr:LytR C-terminal domain-containing protein [Ignavibacterium sp.]MCX7610717.1 LytR C-terminal domain-containing protein [Ignavibacterium sp.]MDW8375479.1 LytR C-terminal domain-containing protein [Ignavibacteriales bacterium]